MSRKADSSLKIKPIDIGFVTTKPIDKPKLGINVPSIEIEDIHGNSEINTFSPIKFNKDLKF